MGLERLVTGAFFGSGGLEFLLKLEPLVHRGYFVPNEF